MAKYVCDFEQVTSIGDEVCNLVSDTRSALDTYSSGIENNLSSWSGDAKSAFSSTSSSVVTQTKTDLEYVTALGNYIKACAQAVQTVEEKLTEMKI